MLARQVIMLLALVVGAGGAAGEDGVKEKKPAESHSDKPFQIAVELRDGSRLVGVPSMLSLPIKTSFAKIELPLKLIESIEFADDQAPAKIVCSNGDELKGVIDLTAISLSTSFDKVAIPLKSIARISTETGGVKRGLILYYSLDKDEGAKVTDQSGHGNHGTNHGARWTAQGAIGGAMLFEGQASIDLGDLPGVDNLEAFTFGVWVYPASEGLQGIVGKTTDGNETFMIFINLRPLQNTLLYDIVPRGRGPGSVEAVGALQLGRWQHLLATYDGTQARAYHNGKLVGTSPLHERKPMRANQVRAAIGDTSFGRGWLFRGKIDEVMIFDRTLSGDEVRRIYDARKPSEEHGTEVE